MEKMLIIEGEMIHRVGYRPFLLTEALKRKKITNFEAENIKENGKQKVIINMIGEEQKILEFTRFIKNNFPDYAKDCKVVMEEDKCSEEVMHINDFRDILNSEQLNNIVQGGIQLREDTNRNFKHMDEKYSEISKAMFAMVEEIEKRNRTFEERIEKTEKNIESLLNILTKK